MLAGWPDGRGHRPTWGDEVSPRTALSEALKRLAAATRYDTAEFDQALVGLALLCAEAPVEALELFLAATAALSDPDPDVRVAAHVSLNAVRRRNEPGEELRAAVRRAVEQVEQRQLGDAM